MVSRVLAHPSLHASAPTPATLAYPYSTIRRCPAPLFSSTTSPRSARPQPRDASSDVVQREDFYLPLLLADSVLLCTMPTLLLYNSFTQIEGFPALTQRSCLALLLLYLLHGSTDDRSPSACTHSSGGPSPAPGHHGTLAKSVPSATSIESPMASTFVQPTSSSSTQVISPEPLFLVSSGASPSLRQQPLPLPSAHCAPSTTALAHMAPSQSLLAQPRVHCGFSMPTQQASGQSMASRVQIAVLMENTPSVSTMSSPLFISTCGIPGNSSRALPFARPLTATVPEQYLQPPTAPPPLTDGLSHLSAGLTDRSGSSPSDRCLQLPLTQPHRSLSFSLAHTSAEPHLQVPNDHDSPDGPSLLCLNGPAGMIRAPAESPSIDDSAHATSYLQHPLPLASMHQAPSMQNYATLKSDFQPSLAQPFAQEAQLEPQFPRTPYPLGLILSSNDMETFWNCAMPFQHLTTSTMPLPHTSINDA